MSLYNVGDTVRIASAEEIRRRGRRTIGGVSSPPGFVWPFTDGMFEYCNTQHKVVGKNKIRDLPVGWPSVPVGRLDAGQLFVRAA